MGILICCVIAAILGIVLTIVFYIKDSDFGEVCCICSGVVSGLCIIGAIACVILILDANIVTPMERITVEEKRAAIVDILDRTDWTVYSNSQQLAEFNARVRMAKECGDDFWFGAFVDKAYAEVDEIELDE